MIAYLEERLDVTITLKDKNVSPKMDLTISPDVEEKLREKRAAEFAVWEMARR